MDTSPISSKPDAVSEELRELMREVHDLEQRVSALEKHQPRRAEPAPPVSVPSLEVPSDTVPAIGRALLAIAGAYLLRALTEFQVVPARIGVTAGILYAGFWLWHATRVKAKLAVTVYTLAALFIFVPLIWEATVTLRVIPGWVSASVLTVFSVAALFHPQVGRWSCAAGAAVAMVLFVATRDMLPFAAALLAIGAGAELFLIGTRWVAAFCVDAAILILTLILSRPGGLPEGYSEVSPRSALVLMGLLLLIYAGGAVLRTSFAGRSFSKYEIAQTVAAFGLAAGGALYLTKAAIPIGVLASIAGAACYAAAFLPARRNDRTYAAFGWMLVLAGTFPLVSGDARIALWAVLATGMAWTRFANVQAPAILWSAAAVSGVAGDCAGKIFGGIGGEFPYRTAVVLLIASAVCYCGNIRKSGRAGAFLVAALFVCCASGMAAAAMGGSAIALTALAVALGWSGGRWQRREQIWLMYGLMTIAGAKILFRDFSRENTVMLMASLIVYGAALILLPRILWPKPALRSART